MLKIGQVEVYAPIKTCDNAMKYLVHNGEVILAIHAEADMGQGIGYVSSLTITPE